MKYRLFQIVDGKKFTLGAFLTLDEATDEAVTIVSYDSHYNSCHLEFIVNGEYVHLVYQDEFGYNHNNGAGWQFVEIAKL